MTSTPSNPQLEAEIKSAQTLLLNLIQTIETRVIGQREVAEGLILAALCEGHVLLEGLPGLAKTTVVKTIGEASDMLVRRVQFTPDLLPADLVGTQVYNPKTAEFFVKQGPIFGNLVIADEINRAPAKVQSALLEAMQERQVSIGDQTFTLPRPFLVMATQNPIEQEGTYTLPEAQMDRFLFKINVGYASTQDEVAMLSRYATGSLATLEKVITGSQINHLCKLVRQVHIADKLREYIVQLSNTTRFPGQAGLKDVQRWIKHGASPRASLAMELAAKAKALLDGRGFVLPQDIKDLGNMIYGHRLGLSYEADAEGISSKDVVAKIFSAVEVP